MEYIKFMVPEKEYKTEMSKVIDRLEERLNYYSEFQ